MGIFDFVLSTLDITSSNEKFDAFSMGSEQITETVLDSEKFIKRFKNDIVYFDSNIYMEKTFTPLFEYMISNPKSIKQLEFKLIMPEIQYQEIYNLKKSENDTKAYGARRAFYNIEKLQELELLVIEGLEVSSNKKAYADPEFIKCILNHIQNHENVIFLTEDRDLKIRLRNIIKKDGLDPTYLKIYSEENIDKYTRKVTLFGMTPKI
ncbi:type II toxin-antitoxin system VapC family toxin [Arcobacter sp.]|uniref:type II toxin-antitoxin system VapC family toxin n=1 Tax=Arcobacter sp. TaxID=1872629 RepID=UPI003D0C0F9C